MLAKTAVDATTAKALLLIDMSSSLAWHWRVVRSCMRNLLAIVFALRLAIAPACAGDIYLIDRTRSEAKFEIRYLLSTVAGRMRDISGVINVDPVDPTASSVKFSVETGSVYTGSVELDQVLRSAAGLDVANFPRITFESSVIKNTPKTNIYQVMGDLTLHGVRKRVVLSVEFGGVVREQDGRTRAGFMVRTTLNRKDYAINWNKVLDQGAILIGDDIEVTVNLEAARQAPTATSK
jgi:polyisoprenoid-binding protein YceI